MKRVLLLIACFLLVTPFVGAQTDDESDLIDYVVAAFDQIMALDSVYLSGTQTIVQTITAAGETLDQTIVQDMSGWMILDDTATGEMDLTMVQNLSQDMGLQSVEVDLTMDMRLVDDTLYLRVYDLSPELAGLYPEGWIDLSEGDQDIPGLELLNVEQMTNIAANTGIILPYNEDTVLSIEELPSEELDSGEARVFLIELDGPALLDYEEMEQMLGMVEIPGVDMTAMMESMMDGANYTVQVWIDAEDAILVQIDVTLDVGTDLTLMGQSMTLVQNTTSSYTYSDFNEPFEIEVPK